MTLTSRSKGLISPQPSSPDQSSWRLHHLLNRLQPTPEMVVLLLAVLVGGGAGAGVVLFRSLIHLVHHLMFGEVSSFLSQWGHWTLALIPLLGGIVIGLMRWRVKDFGPGLTTLIEVAQGDRDLQILNPVTKMTAASISLGSGASLGPEGPSVEIGAYFSLLLGQVLKVSHERQQLLLGAGAAAGLAAGFNAPIAGVFFALEVVLRKTFATSSASVVLLAAVVAAWMAQIGLGSQPAFTLPAYEVRSLMELPLYVGLGLLASGVSLIYVRSLRFSQRCFQGQVSGLAWVARIPQPWHPVMAGACLGLISLVLPQILGVGYETVESMLQDVQFPLQLVVALLLVKLVMTAVSFGSGFVGGVFAPALFLGASLGAIYGKGLALILPMPHEYMASAPAYAMVGMAAVLAASVRAPLTSILLLFELTHDYRIVLPLMSAVGLSVWAMEILQPQVVIDNTPKPEPPKEQPLQPGLPSLMVSEAMHPAPLELVSSLSLLEAGKLLVRDRCRSALVMNEADELIGILTLQDVYRVVHRVKVSPEKTAADVEQLLNQPIGEICTQELLYVYADEPLSEATARMSARGLQQLPVVTRELPQRLIGLLDAEDIDLAQAIAKTREVLSRPPETLPEDHSTTAASESSPKIEAQDDSIGKQPIEI
ncbi:MAG: chloride channel protein [Oculatellaceae cyanobacterium Prado106]|jgi:H+/Cl- antiporter ClcA/CBS domain-containing protein|nr:chloride channel protein [Oculatellaceae cyanobacterium Prado106]